MPLQIFRRCGVFALLCLLIAERAPAGDTIVLKNGRRIMAIAAVVDGEKVRYQTPAGELSLPKSIVDHIEKGEGSSFANSEAQGAANLAITPPTIETNASSAATEGRAVHDGAIDRVFLASLESEARAGEREANEKAAMG